MKYTYVELFEKAFFTYVYDVIIYNYLYNYKGIFIYIICLAIASDR